MGRFGARFVLLWRKPGHDYAALETQLREAARAELIHDDRWAVAFRVK